MKKLKPLVTDDPQSIYQWLHNMTVVKNREVYLREYDDGYDLSLVDYCKKECMSNECWVPKDAGPEEFADYMDCDCVVSHFYHLAVGHAELRERLRFYEAVAPDMYEALLLVVSYLGDPKTWQEGEEMLHHTVSKALAKARGEGGQEP